MEVHSGACASVISENTSRKNSLSCPVVKTNVNLVSVTGDKVSTIGKILVKVRKRG